MIKQIITAAAIIAYLLSSDAKADEIKADAAFNTQYVTKDACVASQGPSIQPDVNLGLEKLTLDIWGNYNILEEQAEVDISVDYTQPINDKLSATLGYTYFLYPTKHFNDSQEIFAGLSYAGIADASVFGYHDFVDGKGNLVLASLGKGFKIEDIYMTPSITLGYNDHYFRQETGFSHAKIGVDFSIPAGDWTVTPFFNHQIALSDDFEDITYGGIRLGK
ncbi:hypothetical protein ACFL96_04150 [Thermoproteota archaeon]